MAILSFATRARAATAAAGKRRHGFTVFEAMVTMLVSAIVFAVGVPSMQGLIQDSRMRTASAEMQLDFMLARSEAAKRNAAVTVCGSRNNACTGSWLDPRMVFVDVDNDGVVGAGETLVRMSVAPQAMSSAAGSGSMAGGSVRFLSTGQLVGGAGAIALCDTRSGNYGRSVAAMAAGTVTVSSLSCP